MSKYQELIERIYDEGTDLERTVQRIIRSWTKAKIASADQDLLIDSAALNLQAFYTGLERIFEQTARFDGVRPKGESWHLALLEQMGRDIPERRPPVLSPQSMEGLNELRRFRHVVRNIYATNLDPARIEKVINLLPSLWRQVRAELNAFAEFLKFVEETIE